ncbi:MAG: methyl coenzyme M reductase system, component A2 [Methanoregulaceae archaeon]|nr:methyl coenzyme M reductase system, component A2 [Methanoregulaceae archaeon]
MGRSEPVISVRNLSMEFSGKKVLDSISFELGEGEILGVIGRSGSGKTVLMHLLRGIDSPPTGGEVIYHLSICPECPQVTMPRMAGKPCPACGATMERIDIDFWNGVEPELRERTMRRTAIMFQRTFALYGNDRVIENVLYALDDAGYPPELAISRAASLLDRVKLPHRMMHIARDLSGGEKQRVVLARQLAREPMILFADEPTGTLDPRTARLVHTTLGDAVRENGMGMVITSHFSGVIEDVAKRALLLEEGRIAMIGEPAEVISQFLRNVDTSESRLKGEHGERIFSARDVAKRYITVDRGVIRAVHDVSFDIPEREIFGIIGTSGAGKTTLSRMISGIIEPTGGELQMRIGSDWVDMTRPGINERGRAKKHIGLLHQEYDLYPHRNVLDNLTDAIGLEFPKELALHKARASLLMAGFSDAAIPAILARFPGELSEGERHRVALAQVLIREPRMVILDEPTGTMDPITRRDVVHSILHARQEIDETFIIVSHDMDFVREICDRVALMRGGTIIALGRPDDVLESMSDAERGVAVQPARGGSS